VNRLGAQVRLVALDLDGTLLNSSHGISGATARAIQTLRNHSVRIALVTGRRFRNVARIAEEHGLGDVAIVHNGAVIRHSPRGDVLFFRELDSAVCREVVEASLELGHFPLVMTDPAETRVLYRSAPVPPPASAEYLSRNQPDALPVEDFLPAMLERPVVQVLFTDSMAPVEALKQRLRSQLGPRMNVLETSYPERDHAFLDVIHKDCSKGRALDWLMRRENLSASEVMAFGDNHNDLEMLQVAGHSFLMDNASEDLKRHGFRIAPANDDDGVARIIAQYWD
jgi:Cof subfamily protein (haloacid dehalogenase superfamily)